MSNRTHFALTQRQVGDVNNSSAGSFPEIVERPADGRTIDTAGGNPRTVEIVGLPKPSSFKSRSLLGR